MSVRALMEDAMTFDEAVEKCTKAILRKGGFNEEIWEQYPTVQDRAKDVVTCLEELGLLPQS